MLPKHILEKNTVFSKKGVEIWAFDGSVSRDSPNNIRANRSELALGLPEKRSEQTQQTGGTFYNTVNTFFKKKKTMKA